MAITQTSRGALGWLAAVLAAMLSAATFALAIVFAMSPLAVFAYLSAIPLFFTGLGAGSISGLVATLLSAGALYSVLQSEIVAATYIVLIGLPVFTLIAMAMRHRQGPDGKTYWYPEGFLLTALAVYPCVIFLIAGIMTSGQGDDLLTISAQFLQTNTAELAAKITPEDMPSFNAALEGLSKALPAISGSIWMLLMLVSAVASQFTLKQQGWLLRDPMRLHNLHVPNWLIGALITAALCGTLGAKPLDYYGMNIGLMLCVPLFFVGITVIHAMAATVKMKRLTLTAFYFFLLLSPKVAALVFLAVLGVLDQGLNLRRRLAQQPKPV